MAGFSSDPRAFLGDGGDRVAVLVSLSASGFAMDMIELWTVIDGKITRCQPFYFDAAAAARTAKDLQS